MFRDEIEAALRDLPLGGLRVFDRLRSTNDEALAWAAQGAPDMAVIVADQQTAGRGRSGRRWFSPPHAALACSVILRAAADTSGAGRLTGLGALAVAEACTRVGLEPTIKWPNDILVRGRKVAGILVESSWFGQLLEGSVIGMGVNVLRAAVPPTAALSFPATSLETEMGFPPDRYHFLRLLLEGMLVWRPRLAAADFIIEWERRLAFRDQEVQLTQEGQESVRGKVRGLEPDGSLRLETDGGVRVVRIGEIHIAAADDRMR